MEELQESKNENVRGRESSHWSEIMTAAESPEFKASDFVRLILSEMSLAYRELRSTAEHSSLEFKIKPLLAEIQALRAMAESARSVPDLLVESDIVNLDGPKFRYVISQFYDAMVATARELFGDDLRVQNLRYKLEEKLNALLGEWRRDLDDPQVLMAYEEEKRRKLEASRQNQSMYPARYPTSAGAPQSKPPLDNK